MFDKNYDPYDSPGYYQQGAAMAVYSSPSMHNKIAGLSRHEIRVTNFWTISCWILCTGSGYLKKKWWGRIGKTRDKSKATKWLSSSTATKWAKKHGYYID